jgi:hypothetical protein
VSTPGSGTRRFADVKVGDELAPLSIDVSARLIVAGAIATRDFQDVHHDKDGAQALGSPHIFMNILTTNGLVGRYVTDWAGPEAMLRSVKIRLGAPNYPGDVMVFSGKVVSVDAGEQMAEIEVAGKNRLGYHVTGSVTVTLP